MQTIAIIVDGTLFLEKVEEANEEAVREFAEVHEFNLNDCVWGYVDTIHGNI